MFKCEWKVFIIVLFCFCCMPPLTVLADDEVGMVTIPETGISQDSQVVQGAAPKGETSEEVKKEEPQVLVAGSTSLPGQGRDAKESYVETAPSQPSVAPSNAAEPAGVGEGGIALENVVVGKTQEVVSDQEPKPAASAAASIELDKKEGSAKAGGEIKKIAVNEPQDDLTQWVWGEVISVDPVKKQITVKYLDYETYDEAVMALDTNDSTVFDNVAGINEIKPQDYVTIDYRKLDSSNLSMLIVVEKKDIDVDKKEAAILKEEKADAISSGGLAAAQSKLNEDIAVSEEAGVSKNEVLNDVMEKDDLDSLDDITVPLAPLEAQPDIISSEPVSAEDINPEHQQE